MIPKYSQSGAKNMHTKSLNIALLHTWFGFKRLKVGGHVEESIQGRIFVWLSSLSWLGDLFLVLRLLTMIPGPHNPRLASLESCRLVRQDIIDTEGPHTCNGHDLKYISCLLLSSRQYLSSWSCAGLHCWKLFETLLAHHDHDLPPVFSKVDSYNHPPLHLQ